MAITVTMGETALTGIDGRPAAADREALLPMDEDAFRAFYDRTSRGVWAYLARITGDRQLADDLLQETYYRFYRASATYESETHRRNSLFCIATNIARDVRRRRSHGINVPLEEDERHPRTVDDRSAARSEEKRDLARALEKLKPLQREMLWLAYAHGSSHNEIAEIVGVKASSVKLLLFRARRKLAALLRERRIP